MMQLDFFKYFSLKLQGTPPLVPQGTLRLLSNERCPHDDPTTKREREKADPSQGPSEDGGGNQFL